MLRLKKSNQRCSRCGKGSAIGKNRPNSLHSTKRLFQPNLQKITLPASPDFAKSGRTAASRGGRRQILTCTGCLRTMKKNLK